MSPRLKRNECLQATTAVLEEYGVPYAIEHNGRQHVTVRCEINGKRQRIVVAGTPSDRRSMLNGRAFVRRLCRQCFAQEARA